MQTTLQFLYVTRIAYERLRHMLFFYLFSSLHLFFHLFLLFFSFFYDDLFL